VIIEPFVVKGKTPAEIQRYMVHLATEVVIAKLDIRTANEAADRFRESASKYYDIRGWARLCENTPEGHAEFYRESCQIIFGEEVEDDSTGEEPK
jgi:hypothetical protein